MKYAQEELRDAHKDYDESVREAEKDYQEEVREARTNPLIESTSEALRKLAIASRPANQPIDTEHIKPDLTEPSEPIYISKKNKKGFKLW